MTWLERCKDSSFYVIFVFPGIAFLKRIFPQERLQTASAMLVLFLLTYLIASFRQTQSGSRLDITPEHVSLFTIQEAGLQSTVYQLFVALVFFASLLRSFFSFQSARANAPSFVLHDKTSCILDTVLVAAALFLFFFFFSYYDRTLKASLLCCLLFFALEFFRNSRTVVSALLLIVMAVFAGFYVAPLFTTYLFSEALWFFDHHWAGLVGPGLFGAIGELNGRISLPEYGFFFNEISTAFASEKSLAAISDVLTVFQAASLLFSALFLVVIWQRLSTGGVAAPLLGALCLLLLFTNVLSGYSSHFETPNQLPIRYFFFAPVLVFAFCIPRMPALPAWFLSGAVCLVAILYNLEVGLVSSLGLGFALFVWTFKEGVLRIVLAGLAFVAGITLAAVLVHFVILVPFGLTVFRIIQANLELLSLFGAGYGGLSAYWYPPFFVMLAHCIYLFSIRLQRMKQDTLSGLEFQTVVLIGLIVGFTPYVMNRFAVQNMWVPFLLYLILLMPWLFAGKTRVKRLLTIVYAFVFVFPLQYGSVRDWPSLLSENVAFSASKQCDDRARLALEICDYVVQKSAALNMLVKDNDALWISALPLTTNLLAEQPSGLSKLDPFAYARTNNTQAELISELQQEGADLILIDNPDNVDLSRIPQQIFDWQRRFVEEAGFVPVKTTPYWILAERREP